MHRSTRNFLKNLNGPHVNYTFRHPHTCLPSAHDCEERGNGVSEQEHLKRRQAVKSQEAISRSSGRNIFWTLNRVIWSLQDTSIMSQRRSRFDVHQHQFSVIARYLHVKSAKVQYTSTQLQAALKHDPRVSGAATHIFHYAQ